MTVRRGSPLPQKTSPSSLHHRHARQTRDSGILTGRTRVSSGQHRLYCAMTTVAARHHTAGMRRDPASRQSCADGKVLKRSAKPISHWSRDGKAALIRCENSVNSFLGSTRGRIADDLLDRSSVQMAKLAQWCLDEGVDDCWKTIWKLSVWTLSKVQTSVNNDGLHICDQAVAHARKWILPHGHRKQRTGAPWLEWCSHCMSLLCWVTRTISSSGRGRRRRRDAAKHLKNCRLMESHAMWPKDGCIRKGQAA